MAGLEFNGISVTPEQLAAFKAWLSANGGLPAGDFAPGGSAAAQVAGLDQRSSPLAVSALPAWRGAVAAVLLGQRDGIIQSVGDSTSRGVIGITGQGASYIGGQANSYPALLARALKASGIPAEMKSWFGSGGFLPTHTMNQYEPRVTHSGGWAFATAVNIMLGKPMENTTDTAAMTFTETEIDTCDIYYEQNVGNGVFSWAVDGGAATNVDTNGTQQIQKITVPLGSAGTHATAIRRVSGTVRIYGMECYNSTKRVIRIRSIGEGSTRASQWISTSAYAPGRELGGGTGNSGRFTADLHLINLGINDWVDPTEPSEATYQANMVSIGQAAKRTSAADVVYIKPFPTNVSSISSDRQVKMNRAIDAAAALNGAPVISWPDRVKDFATALNGGFCTGSDGLHPTPAGYLDFTGYLRWVLDSELPRLSA